MTRRPIEKGKSLFQPVTTTFSPSAKVPASLSQISVPRKQYTVTTDYIIPRVEIFGPEFISFTFGGQDIYKTLSWQCVNMDKACHTFFLGTGDIFVINCYDLKFYS